MGIGNLELVASLPSFQFLSYINCVTYGSLKHAIMKLFHLSACAFLLFIYHTGNGQSDSITTAGATPQLVSAQFSFTEGPAVDKKGNIFFTDQPNDKIWEYDTDGKLSLFMEKTGRSNGLYFDKKGNLVSCADEKDELWSIDKNKKVTVLLKDFGGHRLNGPNDLWVHPGGGIYFTDPYYQRSYWDRKTTDLDGQKVYYMAPGKEPVIVEADMMQPNGIVGTPDGKFLYVADIKGKKTYKYFINKDGSLTDKKLFVEMGSDGLTLDNRGNVYFTGNGVTVYTPEGKLLTHIGIPSRWTANLCFGGKKRNILLITATESVYVLPMLVKGVE
jgi:gluconolactonase